MLLPALFLSVFITLWIIWAAALAGVVEMEEPPPVDFVSFWSASQFVLEGDAQLAYDVEALDSREKESFGEGAHTYPWLYPPSFLLLLLPFGVLSFGAAFIAWTLSTAALAVVALRRMSPSPQVLMLGLLFPATLTNAFIGQNGFLTAALFGWGMLLLSSRPAAAGAVLGLLSYKPQFFPLVALALLASRNLRALAAALSCAAGFAALSTVVFGASSWVAFVSRLPDSADWLYSGAFPLDRLQSVTSALVLAGAPKLLAQAGQAIASAGAVVFVAFLWRREGVSLECRAAGLALAILLGTPYSLHYDLTLLGLALLWLWMDGSRTGLPRWDAGALALGWVSPVLNMILASALHLTITPLVLALLIAVVIGRVRSGALDREPQYQAAYREAQPYAR